MRHANTLLTSLLVLGLGAIQTEPCLADRDPEEHRAGRYEWVPVSGTGVHYFSEADVIVHEQRPTANGFIQRSTDTIDLSGDLHGRVLYHPTSVFNLAKGTLVNTGHQVFSGTVLGSVPVLLHDHEFRFDVDLATGATTGRAFLENRIAGPRIRCELQMVGTGVGPDGNATVAYSGQCRVPVDDGVEPTAAHDSWTGVRPVETVVGGRRFS
ncbi:MAG: hypothetical protein AAGE01_12215 [Pseudomonadota bacterium]